ncbi:MAG: hypothetical protein Q4F05_12000 [bacterium]|nr:hypothetical protein [bacterium]
MVISTQNQFNVMGSNSSSTQAVQATQTPSSSTETASSTKVNPFEITDVYESSSDTSAKTSLKTYSNIVSTIKSSKQAAGASTGEDANMLASIGSQITGSSNASSSVTSLLDSASSDSSEDEEETTTEMIYNADGSVYEKRTTTDEDGNETVTMTKISDPTSDQLEALSDTEEETASALASTVSE